MSSSELKLLAKEQMKGRFWMLAIATLIIYAITGASMPVFIGIIIMGPLMVGLAYYLLDFVENKNSKGDQFEILFKGFTTNIATPIVAYVVSSIFIFLYTLLLVIPGIIKALAYSMVSFIIADDPTIDAMEALRKSEDMMRGHKMRLFYIHLSFIGWYILSALTFGILLIYVIPYQRLVVTNFYLDLRGTKKIVIEEN
ncbi:MAG: hypothetical protein CVV61_00905 [Tenericutes bacterium HGW-Tenericutes-6]|jgi:uncharacterized membrane protein|nr:MAG: hypothetical protein CVV61_00905 [Tenericutes bacterium HGW-Tenericutes-6]